MQLDVTLCQNYHDVLSGLGQTMADICGCTVCVRVRTLTVLDVSTWPGLCVCADVKMLQSGVE